MVLLNAVIHIQKLSLDSQLSLLLISLWRYWRSRYYPVSINWIVQKYYILLIGSLMEHKAATIFLKIPIIFYDCDLGLFLFNYLLVNLTANSLAMSKHNNPDYKVRRANMGPTWVLSAPDGPHVGPMNLTIRKAFFQVMSCCRQDSRHNMKRCWPRLSEQSKNLTYDLRPSSRLRNVIYLSRPTFHKTIHCLTQMYIKQPLYAELGRGTTAMPTICYYG